MPEISKETIYSALHAVQWDGKDIVSREMVVGVTFSEEGKKTKVNLILDVPPGRDADLEELEREIQKAAGGVKGVSSVSVIFTTHQAAHHHDHREHDEKQQDIKPPHVKHIVAVASGKGGVGKSTVAVNLAAALSQKGLKIGLLDADVYGPSIPRMMGLYDEPFLNEKRKLEPLNRDGIEVMSMGFLIGEDQPMMWRGPLVHGAIVQMFRDVLWGELDVLVVDLPPGTGDAQITLTQSVPLAGAVIVSTPQDVALLDARKALAMFQKTDVPILGIVENMSYFECPHCHERSDIFGHGGAQAEAKRLNVSFLGEIPIDMKLRELADSGEPLTLAEPKGPIAEKYKVLADKLWAVLNA